MLGSSTRGSKCKGLAIGDEGQFASECFFRRIEDETCETVDAPCDACGTEYSICAGLCL